MTLTIDNFTITGSPEEIDAFIKLYRCKPWTINTPSIYPYNTPLSDPSKWTVTCAGSSSVSIGLGGTTDATFESSTSNVK